VTVKAAISLALLPPVPAPHHRARRPGRHPRVHVFIAIVWGALTLVLLRMTWVIVITQWRGIKNTGPPGC